MLTEELHRTYKGRDPNEVSRALQELTPRSCVIVDRRNRPVLLSSAGYVLRFGNAYRLQIRAPFRHEDIQAVRIISPPEFLTVESELSETDDEGRSVRTIPFTVSVGWLAQMLRLNLMVCSDDLQIAYTFRPGVPHAPPLFSCPIVARPKWTLVWMAVLAGLLWLLIPRIASELTFAEQRLDTIQRSAESLLRWDSLLWLAGVALVVWLVITLLNSIAIYRRSRQLQREFEERYPAI
jgi:hypothetical protein